MWNDLVQLWHQHAGARLGLTASAALLLALVACRLVRIVLKRLVRERPLALSVLERARAPMDWLVPLLMLGLALRASPDAPALIPLALVQHVIRIGLIAAITALLLRSIGVLEQVVAREFPVDRADNLEARRVLTQVRVLGRTMRVVVVVLGLAAALLSIPGVRQLGASLLASAGLAGLAIGLAARPVLANLIAGVQIALTQPIRLDDVVIIEGEWGRVEEITGTYVVVRIWDERRLVVPLNWFIEHPFQNWTRTSAQILGTVYLWLDYRTPLGPLREELARLCRQAPEWDGRVCLLQVTEAGEHAMQLRALVSSADAGRNWDLRCVVREGLLTFIQQQYPDALPRWRGELSSARPPAAAAGGSMPEAEASRRADSGNDASQDAV